MFINLVTSLVEEEFDLVEKQRTDAKLIRIINQLDSLINLSPKERKKLDKYRISDGILYKITKTYYGDNLNVVVPDSLKNEILRSHHDEILSGHPGIFSTYLLK